MFISQVDIKSAFLNGILEEDLWVWSLRGLSEFPSRCYKLKKALYGLNQAHLAWHKRFCNDLTKMKFIEVPSAPCVFLRRFGYVLSVILVCIDDLLILSDTMEELGSITQKLKSLYDL